MAATAGGLVAANLVLLRPLGAAVQCTGLVAAALLAVLAAPFAAWAGAAFELGRERLEADGLAAGSAVRVAAVAGLTLALPAVAVVFVAASSPLTGWMPLPTSGALFWVRAGLALPAVALGLALGAGLLLVERPVVLIPGLIVVLAGDLAMAWWWMARGIGGPGMELAGVGMGCAVGALTAAVVVGASALGAARPRRLLALHQPTPFPLEDVPALVRRATPAAALAVATAACVAGLVIGTARAGDGGAVAVAGSLAVVLALAAGGDVVLRGRRAAVARWLVVAVLVTGGAVLIASPVACAAAFLGPADAAELPRAAVRLVGGLALLEAGVAAATVWGVLQLHPRPWVEAAWVIVPAAMVVGVLAVLGHMGPSALVLALLVTHAASLPWSRRWADH